MAVEPGLGHLRRRDERERGKVAGPGLGQGAGYAFMALFSALGAYAMLMLWRRATAVEPVTS